MTPTTVYAKCGGDASRIWAWMQEQESCRRSGKPGEIVHTAAGIAATLRMEVEQVKSALFSLIVNGFIRYDQANERVKAA